MGGVPGEPWPEGKCSQILGLMPFKPAKKFKCNKTVYTYFQCQKYNPTDLKNYVMDLRRYFLIGWVETCEKKRMVMCGA